ncbi:hypothetical protein BGZ95_001556 [Linnemannia exigua]|uniref:Uncharacterized protein n=1 Tax=Linnemannia exigua TaxID=604196 RepID=A0AAD4D7A3_9FUNG|nr:hypothetical protein BGZ95_001556 [Linnemannia exigua]
MKTSTSTLLFTLSAIVALVGHGQAAPIIETSVFKRDDQWDSIPTVQPQQNHEPSWEKRDDQWDSIPTVRPQQNQEPSWEKRDDQWGSIPTVQPQQNQEPSWEKRDDQWDSIPTVRPQQNQEPSWEKRDDQWGSIPTVQPQQNQEPSLEKHAAPIVTQKDQDLTAESIPQDFIPRNLGWQGSPQDDPPTVHDPFHDKRDMGWQTAPSDPQEGGNSNDPWDTVKPDTPSWNTNPWDKRADESIKLDTTMWGKKRADDPVKLNSMSWDKKRSDGDDNWAKVNTFA